MQAKLYPFSMQKHAHDIEFRRNRCYNLMTDMERGETPMDAKECERFESIYEKLTDLLTAQCDGRIAWLTGEQISLAKETVAWAALSRAESLMASGKTQYLQYV